MDLNNPILGEAVKKGVDNIKTVGGYLGKAEDWLDDKLGMNDMTPATRGAVDMAINYSPMGAMTAFHGSKEIFNKFSNLKIGTGNKSQIYGHGTYFSESPEIAEKFASKLKGDKIIYKTDIPEKDKMLDWDEPLSNQNNFIKSKVKNIIDNMKTDTIKDDITGDKVYKFLLKHNNNSPQKVSELLDSNGIKGISYLDYDNNIGGKIKNSFVVFNENNIKILDRIKAEDFLDR